MADDKDALIKLKDLAHLKNQLEDIQKRVEEEVQAGIPQVPDLEPVTFIAIAAPFFAEITVLGLTGWIFVGLSFKGFLAGYVVAKLRSSAVMGVLVGTCTGIYAAQSFDVSNIEKTIKDYFNSIKKGPN